MGRLRHGNPGDHIGLVLGSCSALIAEGAIWRIWDRRWGNSKTYSHTLIATKISLEAMIELPRSGHRGGLCPAFWFLSAFGGVPWSIWTGRDRDAETKKVPFKILMQKPTYPRKNWKQRRKKLVLLMVEIVVNTAEPEFSVGISWQ